MLSTHIHMEGMVVYVLGVCRLQFHYLVYLNGLGFCILLVVGSVVKTMLQFSKELFYLNDYYVLMDVLFVFLIR